LQLEEIFKEDNNITIPQKLASREISEFEKLKFENLEAETQPLVVKTPERTLTVHKDFSVEKIPATPTETLKTPDQVKQNSKISGEKNLLSIDLFSAPRRRSNSRTINFSSASSSEGSVVHEERRGPVRPIYMDFNSDDDDSKKIFLKIFFKKIYKLFFGKKIFKHRFLNITIFSKNRFYILLFAFV
jgi:hypothetical protein